MDFSYMKSHSSGHMNLNKTSFIMIIVKALQKFQAFPKTLTLIPCSGVLHKHIESKWQNVLFFYVQFSKCDVFLCFVGRDWVLLVPFLCQTCQLYFPVLVAKIHSRERSVQITFINRYKKDNGMFYNSTKVLFSGFCS